MDLSFRCFTCNSVSALTLSAEDRNRADRMLPDPSEAREMTFYCERCGAANAMSLSPEQIAALLHRLTSNDGQIQRAIDDAKRGDFGAAFDVAKRFGF